MTPLQKGGRMLSLLFTLLITQSSFAGKVKLGDASSAGSGCSQPNNIRLTVSPDDKALSVLFDTMVVESGGLTSRRDESKTCSFKIPIEIEPGMSLSVAQVDYRGFVLGEKQNIFNHISSDFYLDNKPVRHFERKLQGPINDVFTLTEVIPIRERHKSNCSGKLTLSVATRISTKTNPQGDSSMIALDSLDSAGRSGGIFYRLEQTPCQRN